MSGIGLRAFSVLFGAAISQAIGCRYKLFYEREKNREIDKVCIKILMRLHKRFEPHCVLFWPK